MFGQQILQLSDAFVDSVTSFLFDESVWQLVRLLKVIGILSVKSMPLAFKETVQ